MTDIGETAFFGNINLTEITLPKNGFPIIGKEAFSGCKALKTIVFRGTQAQWSALNCTAPSGVSVQCGEPGGVLRSQGCGGGRRRHDLCNGHRQWRGAPDSRRPWRPRGC
ncbi:MAG: leucine-rich repeat protein [Oscillibacter sp.]|nr:leucine-rich repeat protein [Oscillibacter sp.]